MQKYSPSAGKVGKGYLGPVDTKMSLSLAAGGKPSHNPDTLLDLRFEVRPVDTRNLFLALLKACCVTSISSPGLLKYSDSLCCFKLEDSRPTSSIVRIVRLKFNLRSRVKALGKASILALARRFGLPIATTKRWNQVRENMFMRCPLLYNNDIVFI
jgi:hypothetical protein